MTLEQQIDFGAIHTVADQRGGKPVDQANAAVGDYLRQRNLVAVDAGRIKTALSCMSAATNYIERGWGKMGLKCMREGIDFVRERIEETEKDLKDRIGEAQS